MSMVAYEITLCHQILSGAQIIEHSLKKRRSLAFRASFVTKILLDLDSYGSEDPLGTFPRF